MSPLKLKSWKQQIDLFDSTAGHSKQVVVVKRAVKLRPLPRCHYPGVKSLATEGWLQFKSLVVSVRTGRIPGDGGTVGDWWGTVGWGTGQSQRTFQIQPELQKAALAAIGSFFGVGKPWYFLAVLWQILLLETVMGKVKTNFLLGTNRIKLGEITVKWKF